MGERRMKKEKRSSQKKASAAGGGDVKPQATWPNLLISFQNRDRHLQQFITSNASMGGGITKSWIPPSTCNNNQRPAWPQLVQIDIPPEIRETPVPGKYSLKRFSHQRQMTLCCDNDQIRTLWWGWRNGYGNAHFRRAAHAGGSTSLIITGLASPAFAFSRREEIYHNNKNCYYTRALWTIKNCRVMEPCSATHGQYMEFTNAIGLRGKFYAISRQGSLALIEGRENFGDYASTRLGRNRAVPCKPSRHFREYLLTYRDEIFLVLLLSVASVKTVDGVEVFRLDGSRLFWEKIEGLPDDAVFFVEEMRCLGISAGFLGCRGASNCVYFSHDRSGTWFCFDMKTGGISTTAGPVIDSPIS